MDIFELRDQVIGDYRRYVTSFMALRDQRIKERVESKLEEGLLWPEPRIGLNPAFAPGGSVNALVDEGLLHPTCRSIFRAGKQVGSGAQGTPLQFHRHQADAIRAGRRGDHFVLTTGTGSGKSLGYIVPIVDHVLRTGSGGSIKAIVVYPMNALANSQHNELEKFLVAGFLPGERPVTFARYTGQEGAEAREQLLTNPPDILLTNYVMLELVLTRVKDRRLVNAAQGLRFLVLDELHTYRGRQGADVAMLVRRLREACSADGLRCIGTSATLATEGSWDEQRQAVAHVARTIFGAEVHAESVIGETLTRGTREADSTEPTTVTDLRSRVEGGQPPPEDAVAFVADPLSGWIESTFGLHDVDGRLVRTAPRPVGGKDGAARDLAELTGCREEDCATAIRKQLLAGSNLRRPGTPFPVFAFRLHQFISRGDTVFASLEPEVSRHLTLEGQRFVPGARDKVLLPLAFCRSCGQEYYTVRRVEEDGLTRYVPRPVGERGADAELLYLSSDYPWPDEPEDVAGRVPEDWLEASGRVKKDFAKLLPGSRRVHPDGRLSDGPGEGQRVWAVPAPFRLCLRCGTSYQARLGDVSKLATLGSEGRSTATTVLSMSIVRMLRSYPAAELPLSARKLLSFTDNRQDAALQAGHFNDFVRVALLRAALHQALVVAGLQGLEHDQLTKAVFDALELPLAEFALDPDVEFGARTHTERAFREVLAYRLYVDLQPGWRITQPDLERCDLLRVEYPYLNEVADADHLWTDQHPALRDADPATRNEVCRVLLDHLRRRLAIRVDALDIDEQEAMVARVDQRINDDWNLPAARDLTYASVVLPRSRQPGDNRQWTYLSARSGFGQYLRRPTTFPDHTGPLDLEATGEIIRQLLDILRRGGMVAEIVEAADGTKGYQIPADALRWQAGDGSRPYRDPIRTPTASREALDANRFFTELYTELASDLVGLTAAEHTAQVRPEDRLAREAAFRKAELPVLYCSPTMELGVDIADLNVVNMRNVPPTPANYAQRSGRAGRSAQPALVVTYCSVGSPHDQWYFRRPERMVSGQVAPPRIDLGNEDLLRAHVQAVWLAAVGLDLGSSVTDVIDVESRDLPVSATAAAHLADSAARQRAAHSARVVLAEVGDVVAEAPWWSERWVDDVLDNLPREFERAAERWRTLYRSAETQFDAQTVLVKSHTATAQARKMAKNLRREAEIQLELLVGAGDTRFGGDFYSYRYFAAEGFLPGYSFPRLPLSAFVPAPRGRRTERDGEFVSRPRFLAISEFGPRSLIYHEGNRYEITKVILPPADLTDASGEPVLTTEAKRCDTCGYVHPSEGVIADVCQRCASPLPSSISGLFRLQNVSTRRRERISSNEEERRRQGFELLTAFRFAERNGVLSMRTATVEAGGHPDAFALTYGDTTTLWRFNLGRRRRARTARRGFVLDIDKGTWGNDDDDAETDDPMGPRTRRVIPYVEDTRNCLLIEPRIPLDASVLASLQMALHHALLITFQLEEAELLSEPLPSTAGPRLLLFYEAAEGGAGVLRRLVEEPDALAAVARTALALCHIGPDGHDLGGPPGGEPCEAACYDCLLSYYNQPVHELLDRHLAIPVLNDLAAATVHTGPGGSTPEEQLAELTEMTSSGLEQQWLDRVRDEGYNPPEEAQPLLTEVPARPDFAYWGRDAVIYIDGPWHDLPDRQGRDRTHRDKVRALGLRVIEFGHPDDWAQVFDSYRDVFGEGRP
jgi:ATP-dependent helicase YprA (DUF1998 family)